MVESGSKGIGWIKGEKGVSALASLKVSQKAKQGMKRGEGRGEWKGEIVEGSV